MRKLRGLLVLLVAIMTVSGFYSPQAESARIYKARLSFRPEGRQHNRYRFCTAIAAAVTAKRFKTGFLATIDTNYTEHFDMDEDSGYNSVSISFERYAGNTIYDQTFDRRSRDLDGDDPGGGGMGGGGGGMGGGGGGMGGGGGGMGGGGGGGGGGGDGDGGDEINTLEVMPILQSNIRYIANTQGRILDVSGLEETGDILASKDNITQRQIFELSHLLVVPDAEVRLGDQWKAPIYMTVPYLEDPMRVELTYTFTDIEICGKRKKAAINFFGINQFDFNKISEDFDERVESQVEGDQIIQGRAWFDWENGVVTAYRDILNAIEVMPGSNLAVSGYRAVAAMSGDPTGPGVYTSTRIDRTDIYTKLGNLTDYNKEPQVVRQLQDIDMWAWLGLDQVYYWMNLGGGQRIQVLRQIWNFGGLNI